MSVLAELVARRRDADDPIPIAVGDPSTLAVETPSAGHAVSEAGEGELAAATDSVTDDGRVVDTGAESNAETDTETAVDPVCGMTVDVDDDTPTVERDGEPFHFCCRGCADAFAEDPERHVDGVSTDV